MSICSESNCSKIGNYCNKCEKPFCGIHMPTDGGSVKGFHKSRICQNCEAWFVCGFCLEKKPEWLGKHHADTWHCHNCVIKNIKECPDKGERMYFSKDRKIPILKRNGKKHKFRMNYRRNSKNEICLEDLGKYKEDWIISIPISKSRQRNWQNLEGNGWIGIYEPI